MNSTSRIEFFNLVFFDQDLVNEWIPTEGLPTETVVDDPLVDEAIKKFAALSTIEDRQKIYLYGEMRGWVKRVEGKASGAFPTDAGFETNLPPMPSELPERAHWFLKYAPHSIKGTEQLLLAVYLEEMDDPGMAVPLSNARTRLKSYAISQTNLNATLTSLVSWKLPPLSVDNKGGEDFLELNEAGSRKVDEILARATD